MTLSRRGAVRVMVAIILANGILLFVNLAVFLIYERWFSLASILLVFVAGSYSISRWGDV